MAINFPPIHKLLATPASRFPWRRELPRLFRAIGFPEPLYLIRHAELPRSLRAPNGGWVAMALLGALAESLKPWLQKHRQWRGDGDVVLLDERMFQVDAFGLIQVALHELAHVAERPRPINAGTSPLPASLGFMLREAQSAPSTPAGTAAGHNPAWLRACVHITARLRHREILVGLDVSDLLGHEATRRDARMVEFICADEASQSVHMPLREALMQPPPAAFLELLSPQR